MTPFEDGLRGGRVGVDGSGKVVSNQDSFGANRLPPMVPYQDNRGQGGQEYYRNSVPPAYPEGRQPQQQQQPQSRQQQAKSGSGDWSSLDEFMNQFYTNPQAGNQPQGNSNGQNDHMGQPQGGGGNNQPQGRQQSQPQQQQQQEDFDLMGLTASNFQQVANNMDFTQGIPDEILQHFQPDENGQTPNMLKGMMAMMNHVARNSYSNALAGAGRVAGLGLQHYDGRVRKELPQLMRRNAADQVVNNMGLHESLRPSIDAMVTKVLDNNPDASPELIQEMVQGFIGVLRSGGQGQGGNESQSNGLGDLFNF